MNLKAQMQQNQNEPAPEYGVHSANLHPGNASFKERKQLVRTAVQMNPVNPPNASTLAAVDRQAHVLEPSKLAWTLHNIKKSVHSIIYFGDLTTQGQATLRQ